jgi:hypothetical protein
MMEMIRGLVTSKRFWGYVVTILALLFKHFGHDLSPELAALITDQGVLLTSAIWNAVTMFYDKAKAR